MVDEEDLPIGGPGTDAAPSPWIPVHHYEGTIGCAVAVQQFSDAHAGVCEVDDPASGRLTEKPWQTSVDVTDDGLNTSRGGMVALVLTWDEPSGPIESFNVCMERSDGGASCPRVDVDAPNRTWGSSFNVGWGPNGDSIWDDFDRYALWIELEGGIALCIVPSPSCIQNPALVQDWTLRLDAAVWPGARLRLAT